MKLTQLQEAKTFGADDDALCVIYNTRVQKFAQNSTQAVTGYRLRDKLAGNVSFYSSPREARADIERWKEDIISTLKDPTYNNPTSKRYYNQAKRAQEIIDYFVPVRVTVDLPR